MVQSLSYPTLRAIAFGVGRAIVEEGYVSKKCSLRFESGGIGLKFSQNGFILPQNGYIEGLITAEVGSG